MLSSHQSNLLTKVLGWGSLLITIIVYNGTGFDAVNIPKQLVLVVLAGICFGIWSISVKRIILVIDRKIIFLVGFLVLGILVSTLLSRAPFEMNFYGAVGRNTGALTYFCLLVLFTSSLLLKNRNQVFTIIKFFLSALIFNVIYGVYVTLTKKDPFPWNNPYGNFLGTLGNPDFISAFLGIGFAVTINLLALNKFKSWIRFILLITLPIELYLIKETHALQGIMVAGLGAAIFILLKLISIGKKSLIYAYSILASASGLLVVLGMLQIGPLTKFVYKTSVSIRGEYWYAGINMFKHSPIWGIGLDSYGDYFRRFRELPALKLPGVNVVTDTAHNVFIDILAGGGLLLFVPYIAIQLLVLYKIVKYIQSNKSFDPIFAALIIGWVTYLAQSLVSINQIGLAIWGWIFAGLVLAYTSKDFELGSITSKLSETKNKKLSKQNELSAGNFISVSLCVVLFSAAIFPLAIQEHKWRASLSTSKIDKIVSATNAWPQTNQRYIQTAQIFLKSNLGNEALAVVKDGLKFDPDFRDYWFFLYNLTSNQQEKALALQNLKRLDPLNPEYK